MGPSAKGKDKLCPVIVPRPPPLLALIYYNIRVLTIKESLLTKFSMDLSELHPCMLFGCRQGDCIIVSYEYDYSIFGMRLGVSERIEGVGRYKWVDCEGRHSRMAKRKGSSSLAFRWLILLSASVLACKQIGGGRH